MKHQLHATGMESLSRCGIAYERRVLLRQRTPPSARMAIGTAVDRAVRLDLQRKIDTQALAELDEVQQAARDGLIETWDTESVILDQQDAEDGIDKAKAIDTSVGLSGFHHAELAPSLEPTHVARPWCLDVEGIDIQVVGEIDIQEGRCAIRDTKTSAKSPVKTLADTSLQLSTYALAVRQIDGGLPEKVVLDYLVRTPARGDQKLVQLESARTEEQLQPVLERIYQMSRVIESGLFTPAPIDSWWCDPRYCPYHPKAGGAYSNCKFGAR